MLKRLQDRYKYSIILLKELVRADFKVKYQDSVLGYVWSAIKPLFSFAILYIVFIKVLRVGADIEHWPIAMLVGIVLFQFFTDVTNGSLTSIVSNGGLLRKIKFPRYIIVVSGTVSALITLAINSVIILLFAIVNDVPFTGHIILLIPLIIQLFVFSLGVALFLSAAYVKFRDIQYIWELISQALFYGSAILFPVSLIQSLGGSVGQSLTYITLFNPLAQIIQDVRHLIINNTIPSLWTISGENIFMYTIPLLVTAITFAFGAWYFKRRSLYFAEDV